MLPDPPDGAGPVCHVSAGESVAGLRITARHLFSANGVAVELDSKPAQTDASGPYTVELELSHGQGLSCSPSMVRLDLERERRAGSTDFRVGPSVLFAGRISGAGGGYARYRVEVHGATSGSASSERESQQSLAEAHVAEDGEFALPPLLEDLYELRVFLGERIVAHQMIGPAASRDLFITLDGGATLDSE